MVTRLRAMREEQGLSLRRLGAKCSPPINATYISNTERWGAGYEGHLVRLAEALGYDGDPHDLLQPVDERKEAVHA